MHNVALVKLGKSLGGLGHKVLHLFLEQEGICELRDDRAQRLGVVLPDHVGVRLVLKVVHQLDKVARRRSHLQRFQLVHHELSYRGVRLAGYYL